jgi:hypothetical protein
MQQDDDGDGTCGPDVRDVDHESLVIVLSSGGLTLDDGSLAELPGAAVRWQRVEREGTAACVAARVRHGDPPEEFRARIREWGRVRGWAVTVARCGPVG